MRPRTVRQSAVRFTYTWGLGGSAAVLVLLLAVTGILLKFVYLPVPERAYDSIVALQTSVHFGGFIRNVHHWSANLLVLAVFAHMLRVFYTGAYTAPRRLNWITGSAIFGTVLAANFTGYLLPWDQLAYWAVTISLSMLAYLPWIGGWLQELIIGGKELGPQTLSNFFALHTAILPALLLLLLPFHFWRVRKAGGLAARALVSDDAAPQTPRIDVIPDLMIRELAMALAVAAVVMAMAALWDAPLGDRANPGLSPNPTKAPWYFAGLQELLLHLHPVLAVAVVPPVVLGLMGVLPFLPYGPDTSGLWFGSRRGRRIAGAACLAAVIFTPLWVVGHAGGLKVMAILAPLLGVCIVAGLYWIAKYRLGADTREAVQASVTYLVTVLVALTITGIWFRGASMALVWPW
jgi:quinol-cytochrome oxidoreductase complex cytochrome b subunit